MNRLQRFKVDFADLDMAEYYQMNKPYEKIDIKTEVHSDYILLNIHYKKDCPILEFDLPDELNKKIEEYLIYVIEIKIKIKYSPSYPFSPPIWFLQVVHHNLKTDVSLLDYYIYKVNQHNQSYTSYLLHLGNYIGQYEVYGWNPGISVERDMLSFIQKINHFDEVIECL
jgi:hypothetical protein